MLEKIDLDRVFKAARSAGYLDTELYAETRTQATLSVRGRIEDTRLATTRGLALKCFDGRRVHHFYTHRVDTPGLIGLLAGAGTCATVDESTENFLPRLLQPPSLPDRIGQLTQLFKSALLGSGDAIRFPTLQYEENVKYFEVAHSPTTIRGGVEETAELSATWVVDRNGQPERFKVDRCSHTLESLFSELRDRNPIAPAVRRSLVVTPPWPAPCGEIPIFWSARALSKLQLQFLRAFEGDLVLGNLSFLTDLALPVSLPFAVEDRPDVERLACDNEGSPRRPITIFNQGRPKALACNNWIAEQLAVRSTGHCRRQSFQATPTVGFWSPRVVAHQTEIQLRERFDWGIAVHDLDILKYDMSTGEIIFRLRESCLVHQGEEGEAVESIVLRMNLIALLHSLERFDAEAETIGLAIAKNQQRFITEISTPPAVSRPLPIPGSVPPSHYW